jgi:hypothetical protein
MREIAKRRHRLSGHWHSAAETRPASATQEEVVRYLRQQDDVVVPQGDGAFLDNSGFRLLFAELVNRANRMRVRQGKPHFAFISGHHAQAAMMTTANGQSVLE